MWSNTETEVVYHWLVRDTRLLERLEQVSQWKIDNPVHLKSAAEEMQTRVMRRIISWHNNRATTRQGYTYAIRNMYAVVFYPHPEKIAKKIVWAELVKNHSDSLLAEHLDESGEVSL